MSKFPVGTKVFFYKPPSKQEADSKGRRAKHIDHFVGPAKITKHIGSRSVELEMEESNGRNITYKRDIGMLLLKRPKAGDPDPTINKELRLARESMLEVQWSAFQAKLENMSSSRMDHLQRRGTVPKYPELRRTG